MSACKNDDFSDDAVGGSKENCDVILEGFTIAPNSRSVNTLEEYSEIVFMNALGIELVFSIGESEYLNDEATFTRGDSTIFCYQVESFTTKIRSEVGYEFTIIKESKPYFPEVDQMYNADVLKIFYEDTRNTKIDRRLVFRKVIDIKDYPAPLYETTRNIGEKFFINKEFQNVELTEFVSPIVTLYYNDSMGILGYTDEEQELWQLKEKR